MIYLLRHGETLWNAEGRIQGQRDSVLSPRGERQAVAMGRRLAGLLNGRADVSLVSSPLGRTRQTAALVAAELQFDPARIAYDDRLREITWGDWDGFTRTEIEARWPGSMAPRYGEPVGHWNHCPPNGESFASAGLRARDWLQSALNAEGVLVAVAHGAIGRVLRSLHLKLTPADALALDEPQEAFFHIHRNGIERIEVEG
jgi:broad specificity phosphatase PhoE